MTRTRRTVSTILGGMSAAMYLALFAAMVWVESKIKQTIFGMGKR